MDGVDPSWTKKLIWRYYAYKKKPTVGTVVSQATSNSGDDAYESREASSSQNLVLLSKEGTLVDFLDDFEERIKIHIPHCVLVAQEERAKQQLDQNLRPHFIIHDHNFSENGGIDNVQKLQAEHWMNVQYTLFVSMYSFLLSDKWDKTEGELSAGDQVTVFGERSGERINDNSYWAVVKAKLDNDTYEVKGIDGRKCQMGRAYLCHREFHTVAFGGISDDKKHDRHQV